MGAFFRSEEMVLAQLFIQTESSCKIISELGRLGVCQFIDLNSDLSVFRRKFVNVVRRCSRMEDNLASIEEGIDNAGIRVKRKVRKMSIITLSELMHLEITIADTDVELKRLIKCYQDLQSTYLTLLEMQYTLESSKAIFDEIYRSSHNANDDAEEANTNRFDGDFDFIAGVIDRKKYDTFERVLWRLSRGNVFIGRQPIVERITDPVTNLPIYKDCFVIFFKGALLRTKIKKLCEGFKVTIYPCPKSVEERNRVVETVESRVHDLRIIIRQSKVVLNGYLNTIAYQIPFWRENVIRIKAVYHIINGFHAKVGGSYLIGECWLPARDVEVVKETLNKCKQQTGSYVDSFLNIIETDRMPPTMFKTNKFTICYQNIINAYGILSYEEANPALFSIITFPFLFGVMFGDCGHAIILIVFAIWMILKESSIDEEQITNEIYQNFYDGRYLILMMGIFSFYAGLLYNEIFSQSINVFGSSWRVNVTKEEVVVEDEFYLHANRDHSQAYLFGIDPVWEFAENKIIFQNSLKMKLSIIMGVFHMIFGVCISLTNHIHFKNYENIIFEFVPQMLLLCSTFLWLVIMIFLKWFIYSAHNDDINYGTGCAPSILIYFIDMMLMKNTEQIKQDCQVYMFSFQNILQKILYTIYLLSIPWMLCGKSIYHGLRKVCRKNEGVRKHQVSGGGEHDDGFVYQAIHTIEFVLGTVSHTASYLRLWALSLAHSQLSEVLWENILTHAFGRSHNYFGIVFVVIAFALWMFFTVSILIVMEGLSAFLHTLRLHWVEFMSKFYKGGGHTFRPFDLKRLLKEDMQVTYDK